MILIGFPAESNELAVVLFKICVVPVAPSMKVVYSSKFPCESTVVSEMKVLPEESVVVVVVTGMNVPVLPSIVPAVAYTVVGATYSAAAVVEVVPSRFVVVDEPSVFVVVDVPSVLVTVDEPPVVVDPGWIMSPVTGSIVGIVVPIEGAITSPVVASTMVVVVVVEPVVALVVDPVVVSVVVPVVESAVGNVVANGMYTKVKS
jgi:hypothetical protein